MTAVSNDKKGLPLSCRASTAVKPFISTFWLSGRNNTNTSWVANNIGNIDNNNFYNSQRCCPLANFIDRNRAMMTITDIICTYLVCRSNKRRSDDSIMYEMHFERNLVRLLEVIQSRTLQPTAYVFITMRPRPREVFASDMDGRIAQHYIDQRLRPLLDARMTDRSYNNRLGYGPDVAVNRFIEDLWEVSNGFTREAWVISGDLQGFFPNVSLDIAYSKLREVVEKDYTGDDKDELLYLLFVAIYSFPAKHCYRKSPMHLWEDYPKEKSVFCRPDGIGSTLGFLIWQNANNYLLNDFDHKMTDKYGFHYVRYVDDMRWVVQNKEAFLPMMEEFRQDLADIHCTLHPRKFRCQRADAKHVFIGRHICCSRVHCNARVRRNAFYTVRKFNRMHPCQSLVEKFLCTMNSYTGLFKNIDEYKTLKKLADSESDRWLRYVEFDQKRLCFVASAKYRHKELLAMRYDLKLNKIQRKRNGNKRQNQRTGAAPAGAESRHAEVGRARTEMRQVRTELSGDLSGGLDFLRDSQEGIQ